MLINTSFSSALKLHTRRTQPQHPPPPKNTHLPKLLVSFVLVGMVKFSVWVIQPVHLTPSLCIAFCASLFWTIRTFWAFQLKYLFWLEMVPN